jgi:long-chain fatty acid transport protein
MKLKTVSLLTLSVLSPAMVFGLGLRLPDQDAFATGRGEAFVATADNPSAIYYNPAGITQLDGQNVRAGVYGIYLNDRFSDSTTSLNTQDSIQAAPQLYYTYGFQDVPLTLGIGVYSPYGLSVNWANTAPFAATGYEGSLEYLTLDPVIAWKIVPGLSIAAGPTINYGSLDLRRNPSVGFPLPASEFRFQGNGVAAGFNTGVLWQPLDQWSFGANYRSESRMRFSGNSSINSSPFFLGSGSAGADANVPFPQNVVGGVSFRPTPKWNLEFDADWTDWHALKTLTVSGTPINLGGGPISQTFNWESSFFYEFGATYYINDDWHVSGGYIYSENSSPDSTFNAVVPDSDRHIWSLGVGSKIKNFSWDATYQLAWGPQRTVTTGAGSSTFEYLSHAIAISVGYHF